jgi:hypothetical protein
MRAGPHHNGDGALLIAQAALPPRPLPRRAQDGAAHALRQGARGG